MVVYLYNLIQYLIQYHEATNGVQSIPQGRRPTSPFLRGISARRPFARSPSLSGVP